MAERSRGRRCSHIGATDMGGEMRDVLARGRGRPSLAGLCGGLGTARRFQMPASRPQEAPDFSVYR
jgi:hypothetical protein